MLSIFGRSQGAKRRLDGVWGPHLPTKPRCYGHAWRHGEGRKLAQPWWEERVPPLSRRELLEHHGRVRGPFPSRASLLSHSPSGYRFVSSPISAPKDFTRDVLGFSTPRGLARRWRAKHRSTRTTIVHMAQFQRFVPLCHVYRPENDPGSSYARACRVARSSRLARLLA